MAAEAVSNGRRRRARDVDWRGLAWGLLVAAGGTLVPGAALLAATRSVWAVAAAGVLSLLAGGWLAGHRLGRPELLVGATLGVLYFAAAAAVLLGGTLLEALPEPLPGLPVGDSTFFFVWPLAQLAAAVSGALFGGWRVSRGRGGRRRQREAYTSGSDGSVP